ncbi:probable pectinesterase 29 [Magnolia sinica]|uniref:probable pectinesterase 29 n=1 Tax=Magnolia sinica TaxID=86752 RepID=UPI002658F619|nr:probable pectinesterase 29 [Magnolia sinica]
MQFVGLPFFFIFMQFMFCFGVRDIDDWRSSNRIESAPIAKTITVDWKGGGDFYTVQQAIDSVPSYNSQWILIHVRKGVYREKVTVPEDKPFIYIQGEGAQFTMITWDDAKNTEESSTFAIRADNFVAKYITFENAYDHPVDLLGFTQAVAVTLYGDKIAFYQCSFKSVQDTLWDNTGRHYFYQCYIQGAVDFIFGMGQSIYEKCTLHVTAVKDEPHGGYVTAQRRSNPTDPNGFVFKFCTVAGTGKVFLGRAWGPSSRVVFHNSDISDVVVPEGWDAWTYAGHENNITYSELGNTGSGSDMSKRVRWEKKLSAKEWAELLSPSFIDAEEWLYKQP